MKMSGRDRIFLLITVVLAAYHIAGATVARRRYFRMSGRFQACGRPPIRKIRCNGLAARVDHGMCHHIPIGGLGLNDTRRWPRMWILQETVQPFDQQIDGQRRRDLLNLEKSHLDSQPGL